MVAIPAELQPHAMQIPSWVTSDAELRRFKLCFAIGRLVCQRDDPRFVRQLYRGSIPTDVMEQDASDAG